MTRASQATPPNAGNTRFRRVFAHDSSTMGLLQGCPVVTADGYQIGTVESLLMERKTRQLRYVVIACNDSVATPSAAIAIPWHTLYFDSATACLVYYTYS